MATNIRILPENLTNKIAAGEVVERPASVVKELVENALDAGAKEVVVEIESGGRRLIKVSDTGSGMSKEDALLSLERHATSKIACDEDLFSLSTLGFRGEALPSVASVSRLTISTRTADTVEGTEIYAEGGRIKEVKGCGMAAGTVITVRNIFFNTPARLKFMKSAETEGGHVGELLTRLAISRPDVRFSYLTDGKTIFRALDADLKERVATMLGRAVSASLYPVSHESGGLKVRGLIASPDCSRSAGSHLYTYINGRFIRDKVVQHAVLQAYRNFMERGRYPIVALFIEIAPGEVDVNVHPTKHEVRFREQGRVHDAIQYAVESVLKETPWLKRGESKARGDVPAFPGATAAPAFSRASSPVSTAAMQLQPTGLQSMAEPSVAEGLATTAQSAVVSDVPSVTGAAVSDVASARVAEVRELLMDYQPRPQPALRPGFQPPAKEAAKPQREPKQEGLEPEQAAACAPVEVDEPAAGTDEAAGAGYFSSLSVIGQYNASYILCQQGGDLVIVDQHAAHERVAFEKLKQQFSGKAVDSQGLLFPETIELTFRESAVVSEHLSDLERLGFTLEAFGGNTWLLNGVPQIMSGAQYLRILRDILEELGSLSRSRTFIDIQEDILARIACHSVVRGRRPLAAQEITALFKQMDATDFSSNCPHGRPVMRKITLGEVEKMFKRV